MIMRNETLTRSAAIVIAAAITLGTTIPLSAAPALSNTAGVKATMSNPVTDVRYYRRGYDRGYGYAAPLIAGGLALGIVGATVGQGYYGDRQYYGERQYYGPGYGPAYGPAYYGNPYGYDRNF
jgi:hypothetical protein